MAVFYAIKEHYVGSLDSFIFLQHRTAFLVKIIDLTEFFKIESQCTHECDDGVPEKKKCNTIETITIQ